MNKKLAILLSSLLLGGLASAQEQAAPTTGMPAAAAACEAQGVSAATTTCKKTQAACTAATACTKEEMKGCCHNVLTPEERHRFCEVKKKVIAANPALAQKGQKRALCDAILKEDPSMKPILDKLREHCKQLNRKMGKTMRSINEATTAPAAQ